MVILGTLFDSVTAFTSDCEVSLEKVNTTLKQSMDGMKTVSQELLSFYEDDFRVANILKHVQLYFLDRY